MSKGCGGVERHGVIHRGVFVGGAMKLCSHLFLWLIITLVAAYDVYVNIRYPVTTATELNPIASCILKVSNNDLALLMAVKFLGNMIVLGALMFGYLYKVRHTFVVSLSLASFQTLVLLFLLVA